MKDQRIQQKCANLAKALQRLGAALETPMDSHKFIVEATIQCFEFCYELTWKILKVALEREGITANTPRTIFQEAYQTAWIHDEQLWLMMLDDRNLTSHVYNEKLAMEIYQRIKKYFFAMKAVHELIASQI